MAQLRFICMRARPDIQTVVAFLVTRFRKTDKDDWGKIKRVLRYLKGPKHMKLKLSVDTLNMIQWWVDASYGTQWDSKGYTGTIMTRKKGTAMSFLRSRT